MFASLCFRYYDWSKFCQISKPLIWRFTNATSKCTTSFGKGNCFIFQQIHLNPQVNVWLWREINVHSLFVLMEFWGILVYLFQVESYLFKEEVHGALSILMKILTTSLVMKIGNFVAHHVQYRHLQRKITLSKQSKVSFHPFITWYWTIIYCESIFFIIFEPTHSH